MQWNNNIIYILSFNMRRLGTGFRLLPPEVHLIIILLEHVAERFRYSYSVREVMKISVNIIYSKYSQPFLPSFWFLLCSPACCCVARCLRICSLSALTTLKGPEMFCWGLAAWPGLLESQVLYSETLLLSACNIQTIMLYHAKYLRYSTWYHACESSSLSNLSRSLMPGVSTWILWSCLRVLAQYQSTPASANTTLDMMTFVSCQKNECSICRCDYLNCGVLLLKLSAVA